MIPEIGTIIIGGLVIAAVCKVVEGLCGLLGAIKCWWKSPWAVEHRKGILSIIMGLALCGVLWNTDEMRNVSIGQRIGMLLVACGGMWAFADALEKRVKKD